MGKGEFEWSNLEVVKHVYQKPPGGTTTITAIRQTSSLKSLRLPWKTQNTKDINEKTTVGSVSHSDTSYNSPYSFNNY